MPRKNTTTFILSIFLIIIIICVFACDENGSKNAGAINVKKDGNTVEINNGLIKAKFTSDAGGIKQEYFALILFDNLF